MSANRFDHSFYSPSALSKSKVHPRGKSRIRGAAEPVARMMVEGLESRQMLSVSGNEVGNGVAHYTDSVTGTEYVVVAGEQTGATPEVTFGFVARYTIAGGVLERDTTFGPNQDGVVKIDRTKLTLVKDVAVGSDGVIYVAGALGDELSVAAIKLDTISNQYLVTSLGSLSTSSVAGTSDIASSIAVYDSDSNATNGNDKIVVGGTASENAGLLTVSSQFLVAQFNEAGGLDTAFGGADGWITDPMVGYPKAEIDDIVVSGGTIYAGGSATDALNNRSFALATYSLAGEGFTPYVMASHTSLDTLKALAPIPGGGDGVIAAGVTGTGEFALFKFGNELTEPVELTLDVDNIDQTILGVVGVSVDPSGAITLVGNVDSSDAMAIRLVADDAAHPVYHDDPSFAGVDAGGFQISGQLLTGLSHAQAAIVSGSRLIGVGSHLAPEVGATTDLAVAVADATSGLFQDNDFIDLPIGTDPPPVPAPLVVDATTGNDAISVTLDADGNYWVQVGNVTVSRTNPALVTEVVINGGDGNDTITIGAGIMGATVHGGAGNDTVTGGNGNDLIFGETGNDVISAGNGADVVSGGDDKDDISGGEGADILIGGKGADKITGSAGDDVLVAGYTDWDTLPTELNQIRQIWTGSQVYAIRALRLGLGLLLGDNTIRIFNLTVAVAGHVHDDAAVDNLTGAAGDDFFFANIDVGVKDKITGPGGEMVYDIDPI